MVHFLTRDQQKCAPICSTSLVSDLRTYKDVLGLNGTPKWNTMSNAGPGHRRSLPGAQRAAICATVQSDERRVLTSYFILNINSELVHAMVLARRADLHL